MPSPDAAASKAGWSRYALKAPDLQSPAFRMVARLPPLWRRVSVWPRRRHLVVIRAALGIPAACFGAWRARRRLAVDVGGV